MSLVSITVFFFANTTRRICNSVAVCTMQYSGPIAAAHRSNQCLLDLSSAATRALL